MPVIGPPYTSAPPITHCDWSKTSFCATVTNLDILLISPMTLDTFLQLSEQTYNMVGCQFMDQEITNYDSGVYLPSGVVNTNEIAQNKALKDFWNCMAESCGCSSPIPWNVYGCMDDGNMSLTDAYINNRTTWDFYTMNNTTSTGIVRQPDGTSLPGPQWGSRSPNVLGTNSGEAYNYDSLATVDDGSCKYSFFFMAPFGTNMPPNWTPPIPYIRPGCMDSTPHNAADHGFPYGFPDVNGHGTAAVYGCHTASGANMVALTVPTIGDPCGTGPGTPCISASNTGYLAKEYDPCANHSCTNSDGDFDYSSDINWRYTHHLDDPNSTWTNTQPQQSGPGPVPGVGGNPPGSQKWRPFGNTSCCDYSLPDLITPPVDWNVGITYDYRLANANPGGIYISGMDAITATASQHVGIIGKNYLAYGISRWDVVGNNMMGNVSEKYFGIYAQNIPQGGLGTPYVVTRIRVYDIYETLLADYEYEYTDYQPGACAQGPITGMGCAIHEVFMRKVAQHYPPPIYGPEVDLSMHFGGHHQPDLFPQGPTLAPRPAGYVRIDQPIAGTTHDGTLIGTSRAPSAHHVTARGQTKNLGLNTGGTPLHWSGRDLRANIITNPFNASWLWPHACHDCIGGVIGAKPQLHWLEPGPNNIPPTPGDVFYNNPVFPTTAHATWALSYAWCTAQHPFQRIPTQSKQKLLNEDWVDDCVGRDLKVIKITTRIAYNKDKNQEVTITSPSTDMFTPESTQVTTPPPTTPIPPPPPPTTPPPTTPPPTTMTDSGGY